MYDPKFKKAMKNSADTIAFNPSNMTQIDETLPGFFGAKALKRNQSIKKGRHPKSLPKDSELWHYSKVSGARRSRVYKGHNFWDVINDDESLREISEESKGLNMKKVTIMQDDDQTHNTADSNVDLRFLKNSSINDQLKTFMDTKHDNDMSHLELKVDFKNKNQIYYGMCFIITNCNGEILFVDKNNLVRCKPTKLIEPSDRIKFRMVDLTNPTNPSALKFGDPMWLQVMENADGNGNVDNSFQYGQVLATKMYGQPELKSLSLHKSLQDKSSGDTYPKLNESISKSNLFRENTKNGTLASTRQSESQRMQQKMKALHERASERLNSQVATVCGDLNLIKMIDSRKGDYAFYHDVVLNDEKASRYNTKQALVLGRWSVHSALRDDSDPKAKASRLNYKSSSNHGKGALKTYDDPFVYSLSPIFIQQDLYSIGTKHAEEHEKWPLLSTGIIDRSKKIPPDVADTYRKAFRQKGDVEKIDAFQAVITAHELNRTSKKPGSAPPTPSGNSVNSKSNSIALNTANSTLELSKAMSKIIRPNAEEKDKQKNDLLSRENYDYGCMRKVVSRGFPYDFCVDRKCVWQFSLYEQFSDSNTKLSQKDQHSKKIMETATMAMKLSQLNREGARTLIDQDPKDELPPLVSGETFAKTIRELTFKHSLKMEEKYLQERRKREHKIKDHFTASINDVISIESDDNNERMIRGGSFSGSGIINTEVVVKSKARRKSSITVGSSVGSISSMDSYDSRASSSIFSQTQVTVNDRKTKFTDKMNKSDSIAENNELENHEKPPISKEIQEIFNHRNITKLKAKQLLLNNSESLKDYDNVLSSGEQILALHKTFIHLNHNAEAAVVKKKFSHNQRKKPSDGVTAKMKKLALEDQRVSDVIAFKEHKEKLKDMYSGIKKKESR